MEKLCSDNHALRLSKELVEVKDYQKVPQAKFTRVDNFKITVKELEEYNQRANTDSMFVGTLALHLIGPEKLKSMSVTGQASHRFAGYKKADGTLQYPATEKIEPTIFQFICDKLAERVAIRVGPDNVTKIRTLADEKLVKRYIAQKISNLRKVNRSLALAAI
ncbi:uncharacterized protein LOC131688813 [Topomyia yanbarensis]|uniref:uncharacterized protein LOC131688813 n=1 Tax=Topomyia yanbarensis TaxID=2498891 RepID=UPI00273B64E0|nr:uncharacterized protein LOC131688813 [Topomyia yanbarensis]